jgi:hypothetical protein
MDLPVQKFSNVGPFQTGPKALNIHYTTIPPTKESISVLVASVKNQFQRSSRVLFLQIFLQTSRVIWLN